MHCRTSFSFVLALLGLTYYPLLSPASDVTLVGPMFQLVDGGSYGTFASYGPASDSFLTLWPDVRITGWQFTAHRVDADTGALLGSNIIISSGTYSNSGPAVYNSANQEWFIVFHRTVVLGPDYTDIYAQRMASDGTLVGGAIALVTDTEKQHAGQQRTWWFDWISGRVDGEFAPSAWDPVY